MASALGVGYGRRLDSARLPAQGHTPSSLACAQASRTTRAVASGSVMGLPCCRYPGFPQMFAGLAAGGHLPLQTTPSRARGNYTSAEILGRRIGDAAAKCTKIHSQCSNCCEPAPPTRTQNAKACCEVIEVLTSHRRGEACRGALVSCHRVRGLCTYLARALVCDANGISACPSFWESPRVQSSQQQPSSSASKFRADRRPAVALAARRALAVPHWTARSRTHYRTRTRHSPAYRGFIR